MNDFMRKNAILNTMLVLAALLFMGCANYDRKQAAADLELLMRIEERLRDVQNSIEIME